MKYKTLFRLMLKVLGVWLFVTAVTTTLAGVANLLASLFQQQSIAPGLTVWSYYPWSSMLFGPIAQIIASLYLFFGGKWIVDRAIPSNRPYCHECGYDLTGSIGHVCNECGTPFRAAAAEPVIPLS